MIPSRTRGDWHDVLHLLLARLNANGGPTFRLSTGMRDVHFAWWVAEDDRRDHSDCDSAVFVTKGHQADARDGLRAGAPVVLPVGTTGTCTCGQPIEKTQPHSDGWIHTRTRKERCDPMYPQSPTATPISIFVGDAR